MNKSGDFDRYPAFIRLVADLGERIGPDGESAAVAERLEKVSRRRALRRLVRVQNGRHTEDADGAAFLHWLEWQARAKMEQERLRWLELQVLLEAAKQVPPRPPRYIRSYYGIP
jgi:hypothetical protein